MDSPLIDKARIGNAEAIAALVQRALAPKGFTVQGDRQYQRLTLRVSGPTLPPQTATVNYLRQGVERLHIHGLNQLEIYGEQTDGPQWHQIITLGPGADDDQWSPELDAAFAPIAPAPPRRVQSPDQLTWAYDLLQLPPGADLGAVEASYQRHTKRLKQRGDRAALEPLKVAYEKLTAALSSPADPSPPLPADDPPSPLPLPLPPSPVQNPKSPIQNPQSKIPNPKSATSPPQSKIPNPKSSIPPPPPPIPDPKSAIQNPVSPDLAALTHALQQRRLRVQVAIQGDQVQVRLPATPQATPRKALAHVYTAIAQQDLNALGFDRDRYKTLVVCGLNPHKQVVWKQTAPLPETGLSAADTDLFSFENRRSNALIFPALMALGMVMNAMPLVNALLRGIKIWFHEFGHATVAWLAGRQAIPLPIGWTNVGSERSLFVYFGLLFLFGLLYRAGHKENHRWPMILAGLLVILQFWMTWLLPTDTFEMLLSFGGIGGELYLCALLMISFYFPLPAYFRWDFYRYPVVVGAAFTFWDTFGLWKQIARGKASIPFGAMWGDPNHGDMNRLVNDHGWTPMAITGTYNAIANLCLIALVAVYLYVFFKQHRQWLFALSQRCRECPLT